MTSKANRLARAAELRRHAEEINRRDGSQLPEDLESLSSEKIQQMLHELRVHQIELTMQNEELRTAQEELDAERARYFDLYDLAPGGYCTVSESGLILETNLTAAALLGIARGTMIGQLLTRFILQEDQDICYLLYKKLCETPSANSGQADTPQECELRMVKMDGTAFWAHLTAVVTQFPSTSAGQNSGGAHPYRIMLSDITERKRVEAYKEIGREILHILNEPGDMQDAIQRVLAVLKTQTGFDAVGIRLQEGDDFPYFVQDGFSEDFLLTENTLVERAADGGVCRDKDGFIKLECTCGLVISGRTDLASPLFTRGGSCWTNDSFPLLDIPQSEDPRLHPRNNCIHQGYASVALVPVRAKDRIVGLIQLNDRRKGCFSLQIVELLEGMALHIGSALMRKRAEEALRESDRMLRDSQAVAHIGAYITHLTATDFGTNTWQASSEIYKIFGIDKDYPHTLAGWAGFIHPDSQEELFVYHQQVVRERKRFDHQYKIIRINDGAVRWVHGTGELEYDEKLNPIRMLGTIQDITERKLAEETLLASQERLLLATQATNTGIWDWDVANNVLTWDDSMYSLYGINKEDFAGVYEAWSSMVPPEDRQYADAEIQAAHRGEREYDINHRIMRPDGAVRVIKAGSRTYFDNNGKPLRMIGTNVDITELKRAEEALLESKADLVRAQAVAHLGNWTWDVVANKVTWSDEMCRIYGVNQDTFDFSLEGVAKLIHPDDLHKQNHAIRELLAGQSVAPFDYRIIRPDGTERVVEVPSVTIELHTDGQPLRMFGVAQDITERKRAEEENKRLQAQLQQAQKMEAIGTLAGGIAHDFNNILSAILGYAEMVQEDSPVGSRVRKDIDQVVNAGHRAKELVKQILAFSRQDATEHIPVQPAAIIKEALKMLRSSLPSTIDIRQDIDAEAGLVLADPTQIHQTLINLCTNAFHAMEETGGTLTISLKRIALSHDDLQGEPHVQPGRFMQLSVGDTGYGIASDIKEKIFDPYFTTKEIDKGTGMGLAIIHGIVESYQGFITCHSRPGEGTVFHVYLPIIPDTALSEIKSAAPDLTPVGNEHILYIDDEEILAEMGKTMLERLGYRVTARTSSLEALATFQNQPDQFDLVITDQTMPGMTGVDLARRMLQIRPGMPIILCTGFSTLITEDKAKSLGIKGFAMKPLARKDIAALIRKVLEG